MKRWHAGERPGWCEGCGGPPATVQMTTENGTTVWYCRDCADYVAARLPELRARLTREAADRERKLLAEWGTIGQAPRHAEHSP
jgi:hypothetical protein